MFLLNRQVSWQFPLIMNNEVSISQEQADMINASVQPALDSLITTGNFQPTLYVHDGESMSFFTLPVQSQEALHVAARHVIRERMPQAVAYVLLYDSSINTNAGRTDVLIIETGDAEDQDAHEFARVYSHQKGSVSTKMRRLGSAPHLLR